MTPIPLRTKLLFGLGASAEHVFLYSFGFFVMLYYNQVLGLPATLAGLGPTLALVIDAITDPLIGAWSDRFRSKQWGRRHPFMLAAPLPATLFFFALFNPPQDLGQTELLLWLVAFSVLLRSATTLFFVPHLALGGEMSSDYHERSAIMSFNSLGTYIGAAGAHFFSLKFIFVATAGYSSGLLVPEHYNEFSIYASIFVFLALYACAFGTADRIPTLSQPPPHQSNISVANFVSDLLLVLKNRNYLYLLLGLFFLSITIGMRAAFNNYMNIFYWEFSTSQIANFVIGSLVGYVSGFLFSVALHKRFDKRAVIVAAAVVMAFAEAMPVTLRIFGVFPENGSDWLFPGVLLFHMFGSAAGSILNISVMSALADVADENELKHGQRQEGLLYSARTFFSKADRALGTFAAGVLLDAIAFPTNAKPGEVPAETIFNLGLVDSPLTIVPALIGAVFYSRYRIDRHTHEKMRRALEQQSQPEA